MRPDWIGSNNFAIAIIRISSKRQEGNTSHEMQEKEIREYCGRNRIVLKEVFKIVESAKDSDLRKQYGIAIEHALSNQIRHLMFYIADREGRNLTDIERNEKHVRSDRLCIHYVRDNKVIHKDTPDSEFLMRDVQASFNKNFSRALSTKVSDAMREKAEQGWYPSNQLPLGYAVLAVKDESGRELKRGRTVGIDPDEKKVKQVQREFQLRAIGYTYEAIRAKIVEEGFIPADKISQYRPSAIEFRLKNPFYEGRFIWQGEEYVGKHPLIISAQTVQAVRGSMRGIQLVRTSDDGHGALAGAWIHCGACGCAVVYDPKTKINKRMGTKKVFHYYHCRNSKGVHATMSGMNITEEALWAQLDRAVDAIHLTPELAKTLADALNGTNKLSTQKAARDIQDLKAELKKIEQREDRAYDDMFANIVDPEGYKRIVQRLRAEKLRVNQAIETAQSKISGNSRENATSVIELCKHAKELYLSRSLVERRFFLERLVSNPILNGVTIEFDLKKPFNTLAEIITNGEWCTRLDKYRTDSANLQGVNFLENRTLKSLK